MWHGVFAFSLCSVTAVRLNLDAHLRLFSIRPCRVSKPGLDMEDVHVGRPLPPLHSPNRHQTVMPLRRTIATLPKVSSPTYGTLGNVS